MWCQSKKELLTLKTGFNPREGNFKTRRFENGFSGDVFLASSNMCASGGGVWGGAKL